MRKLPLLTILLIWLLMPFFAFADDTLTLQSLLNGGNITLPSGTTYNISGQGVTVKGHVMATGVTFNFTGSSGTAIKMGIDGASLTNGTVQGPWDYHTMAGSPGGSSGIKINANNVVITGVTINKFAGYAILCGGPGNFSGLNINNNTITEIGYICFFYSADANGTGNSRFVNNIVDRSMQPNTGPTQIAVGIRGSTSNPSYVTTGWTITHNTIKMPLDPPLTFAYEAAECLEVRYMRNSRIDSNIYDGGSIGKSIVKCSFIIGKDEVFLHQNREGHEWAAVTNCKETNPNASGQRNNGMLLDGWSSAAPQYVCYNDTIVNPNISTCSGYMIESYIGNHDIIVTGGTLTGNSNKQSVYFAKSYNITFNNVNINGNNKNSSAFYFDNSIGSLNVTGGSITNMTYKVFGIYSNSAVITDNIIFRNVTITGTPAGYSQVISNGAVIGQNIHINDLPSSDLFGGSYTQVLSATITGKHDTTITGKWFYSTANTSCLSLVNCYNVTIVNCIVGQSDSLGTSNNGIYLWNCKNVTVKNVYFKNTFNGVLAYNCQTMKVDTCQFLNMKGGSAVKFQQVSGPKSSISYNRIEGIDRFAYFQHVIDIYQSSGTSTSPITISYNMIRQNLPTSLTGGAILLGDNQGKYQVANNNYIVSPGSYGIGIAGGQHNTIRDNKIFSPAHAGSNISNVAITVSNNTPILGLCNYNTVRGNFVNWFSDRIHGINNVYNPGSCYTVTGLATLNKFGADIDATIIPTQLLTTANPIP